MDKRSLRARMRGLGLTDPETARVVVKRLKDWMSARMPGTAAAYLAMSDEIEVSSLFEDLPGWRWVLPRVEPDMTLTLRDRDVPREIHALGMRQPVALGAVVPIHEVDLWLVPGLAFDRTGARLGRGGGYYDRVLAGRRADSAAVGVTELARLVESVPLEAHDRGVTWLATENGVIECSSKR